MAEVILPPEELEPELPEEQLPEVAKPTELSKVIIVKFNPLDTGLASTVNTRKSFYTTDTDAWITFEIEKMDAPSGSYSLVLYNKSDGSVFQRTDDIVNGAAYYKIEEEEIKHAGDWFGQVVITLANGKTTTSRFSFSVVGHLLDGKDVRQIVIQDFETLMKQLNGLKDDAEIDFRSLKNNIKEFQRVAEKNESERVAAENERKQAELQREESYDSKVDAAIVEADVVTKVDDKVAELSPTIQNVTAQLEQTNAEITLARDGEPVLADRLSRDFGNVTAQLAQKAQQAELELERARIDNLIALPEGATTNDARLEDISVGVDGVTYSSPADAVRSQVKRVENSFNYKMANIANPVWQPIAANDAQIISSTGGAITAKLTGSTNRGRISTAFAFNQSKKYFVSITVSVDAESDYVLLRTSGGTIIELDKINSPNPNEEYRLEGVVEGSNSTSIVVEVGFATAGIATDKIYKFKKLLMIDLTKDFGEDKEPEKPFLSNFLGKFENSFFEKYTTLSLDKLAYDNSLQALENSETKKYYSLDYYQLSNKIQPYNGSVFYDSEIMTSSDIHTLFNGLAQTYPDVMSRTLLGRDQSETYDIFQYEIKHDKPKYKLIILTNVHGNGDAGDPNDSSLGIYEFIKDMLANRKLNPALDYLYQNAHFVIVPCANPWGVNNKTRQNSRNVDLNRNFDYKWEQGDYSSNTYGGDHPFSEAESRIIRDVIHRHLDADGLIDVHAYGIGNKEMMFPGIPSEVDNYAFQTIQEVASFLGDKYNTISNVYTSQKGIKAYAQYVGGIDAVTLEFPVYADGFVTHGIDMMNRITEWYGGVIYKWIRNLNKSELQGLKLNNFTKNGNFANGLTDWNSFDSVEDGVAIKTATAQHQSASQSYTTTDYKGHKIYASTRVKSDSANVQMTLTDGVQTQLVTTHSGTGEYERLSLTMNFSSESTSYTLRFRDTRPSGWTPFYVEKVISVDLTETFGNGFEPTAEEMDILVESMPNEYFSSSELDQQAMFKWMYKMMRS